MNEHEIARLAAALHQARPDWPTKQLVTLMSDARMVDRPRRDVFVALAWVACEASSASPYRVLESGPWWRAVAVESDIRRLEHLAPHERCRVCSKSQQECQRNPWAEHEFAPDIREPHDYDIAPVIAELKGHVGAERKGHAPGSEEA